MLRRQGTALNVLPTLDIAPYLTAPDSDAGREFVRRLRDTCHSPGFFYLAGHGIPDRAMGRILTVAGQFFALPEDERRAIAIGNSPHFRGYTVLGDEVTAGKNDWRDQIDIGPEEPAIELVAGDPAWRRLRGPNQWPVNLPALQRVATGYMAMMHTLSLDLVRALATGLGLQRNYFVDAMTPDPYPRMKISRYPAIPDSSVDVQGLGLHHDSGLFSFVHQNDVTGLQVLVDGNLVDAVPVPGTFVVNLGEMFQRATDGYLVATKHQVVLPPPGRQRISVAYFANPRLDAVFEPVNLPAELAALARGGGNPDKDDPIFRTFGDNTLKIRMRAHPDVTRRYYS